MRPIRRAATTPFLAVAAAASLAAGCTLDRASVSSTPTASAEASLPASAVAGSPTPGPSATPATSPAPGLAQVPRFAAGAQAVTNAPGLRVRSRPGTDQRVVTTLGVDADLLIGMGPVWIDDLGWYLVRDADEGEPEFSEGWVAAGFEPDPFLISGSFQVDDNPFIAGFADTAGGDHGPVLLPAEDGVSMRWIAASLDGQVCSFAVDLRHGSDEPVAAVRTPVGSYPASGELPTQFFEAHPELASDLLVGVESSCSWAVTFVRPVPVPKPD